MSVGSGEQETGKSQSGAVSPRAYAPTSTQTRPETGEARGDYEPDAVAPLKRLQIGERYNPEPEREKTRSMIARTLVLILALISIGLIIATAAHGITIEAARDLAGVVLAPLVVLTGTVFGFYFSGHSSG
jgi:hypothetical protein